MYIYVYLQDIICIHQWNSRLSGSIGHLPVPGKGRTRFVSIQTWMMTKDIKHVYIILYNIIIHRRTIWRIWLGMCDVNSSLARLRRSYQERQQALEQEVEFDQSGSWRRRRRQNIETRRLVIRGFSSSGSVCRWPSTRSNSSGQSAAEISWDTGKRDPMGPYGTPYHQRCHHQTPQSQMPDSSLEYTGIILVFITGISMYIYL